jgi:CBS domain-containing protein
MKARDLMTPNPRVLTGDQPVYRAAELMRALDVGVIPIVDDVAHMRPRGVITDRDITIRCVAERGSPDLPIEDFMTAYHLDTVPSDADVAVVMNLMEQHQLRRLMVTDGGRVVGIISQADLALKEGPLDPLKVEEVLERISEPAPPSR